MPFVKLSTLETRELMPGFHAQLVHGEKMTFLHWRIENGSVLPDHSHPHEQISVLLEGKFELTLDGETHVLTPGEIAVIPPNARHSGKALDDCLMIEMFSPVREEYR